MITATGLELRAGSRILISPTTLRVQPGDRIGLVGRNGAGKTTTLKVLAGEGQPFAGQVERRGSIGYLPQDPRTGDLHVTARDRVLSATRSSDFDSLVRWAASASPSELAGLAPHVLEVAAQGDPLAQGIADYAARELSQLAICLLPLLEAEPPFLELLDRGVVLVLHLGDRIGLPEEVGELVELCPDRSKELAENHARGLRHEAPSGSGSLKVATSPTSLNPT